jgi:mRNA interferase MazF
VPDRGDIVWLDFAPAAGHEHSGRRPAVVLSPRTYNEKTSLALMCPVTSHAKGYPFEVAVKAGKMDGVVLADHLKNLDWRVRRAEFVVKLPDAALLEVTRRAALLIGAFESAD